MQAAFPHTFIFYLKANGKREDPFFSLQPRRPATQKQEPCLLSFSCLLTAPAPTCILIELTTELEESKKLSKKNKTFWEPYFPQFLRFLTALYRVDRPYYCYQKLYVWISPSNIRSFFGSISCPEREQSCCSLYTHIGKESTKRMRC